MPSAPESYVHRIGRTGRAGREGVAITLVEPRERHLLRNIERLTGRRLELQTLPSVADLRARQLEITRESLREALVAGGTEAFRVVVESLAQEFDVLDVAAAAVKLVHAPKELSPERAGAGEPDRAKLVRPERAAGDGRRGRRTTALRGAKRREEGAAPRGESTRIYVSAGRAAGVRPADLVGAITGEAGLEGSEVGGIEIAERYSLVDVPKNRADEVHAGAAALLDPRPEGHGQPLPAPGKARSRLVLSRIADVRAK